MKNILVTVDGSKPSLRALQTALDLAPASSALHVITVQPPVLSGNVQRFIPASDIDAYYHEEGGRALVDASVLLNKASRSVTVEILVGQIAETIADYIQQHNIDHLFMGTRGLGGFKGLILGSVTTQVLNLVDVPVTLVK